MRDLKKEDFVNKLTHYGLIVDAGFDQRIKGNLADQFSFAIDYGHNIYMQPAQPLIWAMAYYRAGEFPYAIDWQMWFEQKLGLTTWQIRCRDGYSSDDFENDVDPTSAAADDEPSEANAKTIAAAAKWVQHVLL